MFLHDFQRRIRKDKKTLYFAIGFLLRLMLMPITMMTDLTHNYLEGFILLNEGLFNFLRPKGLSYIIEQLFFLVYRFILPIDNWFDVSWIMSLDTNFLELTYSIQRSFLSGSNIYLKLFLLKLPFLIFEISLIVLFLKFLKKKHHNNLVKFWMLNPVVIIIIYAFGTPEIFASFFIVFSLFLLSKKKYLFGLLSMCLASWSRFYGFFLLPFVILYIWKNEKKYNFYRIIILPLFFLFFILTRESFLRLFTKQLFFRWPYNYLFETNIGRERLIYIFLLFYFITLIIYWYTADKKFDELIKFSFIGLLTMFAFSFFHLQWFVVLVPFMFLYSIKNKKITKLFTIQTLLFLLLLFDFGNHTTINLFAPLHPNIVYSIELKEIINSYIPVEQLFNIFWTMFVAVTIYIIKTVYDSTSKQDMKF